MNDNVPLEPVACPNNIIQLYPKSGRCDIGVAWNETSEPQDDSEPMDYISVKLDGPEMNKLINAALFDREGGADLVWSRPKAQ